MSATVELFAPSGQTLFMRLCVYGTHAIAADAIAGTEVSDAPMLYEFSVTGLTGRHTVHVRDSANNWYVAGDVWMKTSGRCRVYDPGVDAEEVTTTFAAVFSAITAVVASVWSYATRTLTGSAQSVGSSLAAGATVKTYRDSTWSVTLTGLGVLTGWTKLLVTLRTDPDEGDADSLVQIQLSNPAAGSDGLKYINGAVAGTPANGSITVNNATTGSITIALAAAEAAKLTHQKTKYDVKKFTASSVDFVSTEGTWQIKASLGRAVT